MGFFSSLWKWFIGLWKKRREHVDKVLLVGINQYPGAPLRGCVNDVLNIKSYLTSECKINEGDIHTLTDRSATTQNIWKELEWLINVPTGGRCFFHYSGHGAQVPTQSGSEPDGLAEIICPVDFDWSPARMITDKQFVAIFARIPQGIHFNWASDSCHSGDLDRSISENNPTVSKIPRRLLPPPGICHQLDELKKKGVARAMVAGHVDVGFISGCRSDQTSADTTINGQPCGAFTHHFLKALRENKGAALSDIAAKTAASLASAGYTQVPQAEGPRVSKSFLG